MFKISGKVMGEDMKSRQARPYTENDHRLADVIAAIQVMATYKFYKLDFGRWADRIAGEENKAGYWKNIFEQHPEFFRLDSGRLNASLVWRRSHQKLYDVDKEEKISREEFIALSDVAKRRISRTPLASSDISALVNTAINLHSRELEHKKDSRWWIASTMGLVGVIIGAIITALAG